MKRKLDLRTGTPVWSAYRPRKVHGEPLTRDARTDVLVIGAGISGALIAEALTASGRKVMLVDRRSPMAGSTAATTALVQYEIDQPLTLLAPKIGREKAVRALRRSSLGVANLAARIQERGIDCRMVPRPSLYLDGDVLDAAALEEEALARGQGGIFGNYLRAPEVEDRFGIKGRSAIVSPNNLALDPLRLASGMLRLAVERGARIHAPVEATALHHTAAEIGVETRDGPTIRADQVVLATGYELMGSAPPAQHSIVSTWAIATGPQPRAIWPEAALIWESSDPYLYMRATHDGRVICGGEDEEFQDEDRRDALLEEKTQAIAAGLKKLLPSIDPTPAFAWAGSFGTTSTGLPFIGRVPRKPRLFSVMGYGGNGITYSQIASEMLVTMMAGETDIDSDLFAFPV
jgi:glycine/D-amino acid oxidase-like deaminating enzyme